MAPPKKYHTEEARLEARRAAKRAYYARNSDFCKRLTMAAQARDRAKNPEKYRRRAREYYHRPERHVLAVAAGRRYFEGNRSAILARNREAKLRDRYGLVSYEEMYRRQEGRCAICRSKRPRTSGTRFAVDHDHDTGKIRGLLCGPCNTGMGGLKDSIELLTAAIRYLRNAKQLELGV